MYIRIYKEKEREREYHTQRRYEYGVEFVCFLCDRK